jgi:glycosyltransferase involved in cell wall biosynthesis
MTHEPLFSVVIPTRNRARLLRYALQSAMEQTFDDYEIIVSNNNSRDDTRAVVEATNNGKVRYVETDRTLAMPDHWEFALDQARGQYVTYLCDDDAWCPAVLKRVAEIISSQQPKIVVIGSGLYYGSNWFDENRRNFLIVAPHTASTRECDSEDTLRYLFKCGAVYDAPRMLNSFCHRDSLMRIREETKRIFLLAPDYSFPALTLTRIPTWIYIDEPLRLQGIFPEGIGSTQVHNRGEPSQEFIREFGDTNLFHRTPVKALLPTNYIAETLEIAKEREPAKLSAFEIDWVQYFIRCWGDVLEHERNGVDVTADKNEVFRALSQQPAYVQSQVRASIAPGDTRSAPGDRRSALRKSLRNIINSSSALTALESFIRGPAVQNEPQAETNGSYKCIRGEDGGFSDIVECARRLQDLTSNGTNGGGTKPNHAY